MRARLESDRREEGESRAARQACAPPCARKNWAMTVAESLGVRFFVLKSTSAGGRKSKSGSAPQTWCGEEARNGGPTDAAEARRQARAPLKIVDERPAKVRADVASDRGQGRVPVSTGRRARSRKQSKAGSHGPDSHLVDDDGVAEGAQVALVELDAVRVACGSVEQGRGVSRRAGAKARRTTGAD